MFARGCIKVMEFNKNILTLDLLMLNYIKYIPSIHTKLPVNGREIAWVSMHLMHLQGKSQVVYYPCISRRGNIMGPICLFVRLFVSTPMAKPFYLDLDLSPYSEACYFESNEHSVSVYFVLRGLRWSAVIWPFTSPLTPALWANEGILHKIWHKGIVSISQSWLRADSVYGIIFLVYHTFRVFAQA